MKLYRWKTVGLAAWFLCAQAADFKFGYVDPNRLYREAAPAIAIHKKLDKEFATRRMELTRMASRAKELEGLLSKSSLANNDRKNYERELDGLERDYRAKNRELFEEFNQRRNEEFAAVQEQANRVLKQLAHKEHYDLILQDAVFVNPSYDLTDKVIKELEKKGQEK